MEIENWELFPERKKNIVQTEKKIYVFYGEGAISGFRRGNFNLEDHKQAGSH